MKKLIVLLFIISFSFQFSQAAGLGAGINAGILKFKKEDTKNLYTSKFIYNPYLKLIIHRGLAIELSYEAGYNKKILNITDGEDSTLKITGINICAVYRFPIIKIIPYLKVGYARYNFKQDIESNTAHYQLEDHKSTIIIGGGVNLGLLAGFYLNAEITYTPLKIKPFDQEMDYKGMRFLAGVGWQFNLF